MEALGPVFTGQRLFNLGQYPEAEAMYFQALEQFPPKSAGSCFNLQQAGNPLRKNGRLPTGPG